MAEPYRVLVTGSRTWSDLDTIAEALDAVIAQTPSTDIVVVHGDCPRGADHIAAEYCELTAAFAERLGKTLAVEPHPADWQTYGRFAGPRRNVEMVNLGADVCLAFIVDGSKGASHCADLAERAGIPVRRYERSSR